MQGKIYLNTLRTVPSVEGTPLVQTSLGLDCHTKYLCFAYAQIKFQLIDYRYVNVNDKKTINTLSFGKVLNNTTFQLNLESKLTRLKINDLMSRLIL